MITHRTIGSLGSVQELANAMRDLETERMQILAALNILLADSPAGQLLVPVTDETGKLAMYRLVAGAGMTITFDSVAKTCTLTSP
jgi:alpha-D-ribose 1-methylphosphonate 5-triphosphate synthase subunit PhnI